MVPIHPALKDVKLGIPGQVQQSNASLAIAIVQEHLKTLGSEMPEVTETSIPPKIVTALENAKWPGRCETRVEEGVTWYCDGAHTAESIAAATEWYNSMYLPFRLVVLMSSQRDTKRTRILLFNQQTRNAKALVETLHNTCFHLFDKAIFCSNITFKSQGYKAGTSPSISYSLSTLTDGDLTSMNTSAEVVASLKVQHELKAAWEELSPKTETYVISTIEEAVELIRSWGGEKEVFVTGSLHLVGGLFVVLDEKRV